MALFIPFGPRLLRLSAINMVEKIDLPGGRGFTLRVQVGNLTYAQSFPSIGEADRDSEFDAISLAADP